MKVTTNKPAPEFTPVDLTLTFETQEELDKFATGFNYTPITEALVGKYYSSVLDALRKLNANFYANRAEMILMMKRQVL